MKESEARREAPGRNYFAAGNAYWPTLAEAKYCAAYKNGANHIDVFDKKTGESRDYIYEWNHHNGTWPRNAY